MKKTLLIAALALGIGFAANADGKDPNRMLVINKNQSFTAYNIGYVDSLKFATVEGDVAADVKIKNHSMNKVTAEVKRTSACESFLFNLVPGVIARQLEENPAGAGSYMRQTGAQTYSEDFENGEITGMKLNYGTEYAIVTVGVDKYNVDCDVRAAYFTTEKAPIKGDPKVNVTVTDTDKYTIDLKFEPNSDVKNYYFVIGQKGEIAAQYEQFAGMFGYTNVGEMVKSWSSEHSGITTYQYKDLAPGTVYELYVQTTDADGNMPEADIIEVSTKQQGGSGEAKVDILISDFGMDDWNGVEKGTQVITYTPNDQTWGYRCTVYKAADYDTQRDQILDELASDPPMMGMANWFIHTQFTNEYQIDPQTACVAVAAAKNADGKWGTPTEVRFTTPAAEDAAPANNKSTTITSRKEMSGNAARQGFVNLQPVTLRMVEK